MLMGFGIGVSDGRIVGVDWGVVVSVAWLGKIVTIAALFPRVGTGVGSGVGWFVQAVIIIKQATVAENIFNTIYSLFIPV